MFEADRDEFSTRSMLSGCVRLEGNKSHVTTTVTVLKTPNFILLAFDVQMNH